MALAILRGVNRRCVSLDQAFAVSKLYSISQAPKQKPPPNDDKSTPIAEQAPNKSAVTDPSQKMTSSKLMADAQTARKNVRKNIQGYVFTRYSDYLENYHKVLEKRFPTAMKVYHVFMDGVKDFFKDMKALMKIKKLITMSSNGLGDLTRKELELNYQMPRDMFKVAPVLVLSAIPFGHYVIFPLAYMYPRHLLTSHFWTLQQRNEFAIIKMKSRLEYNLGVLRYLQAKLSECKQTDELYDKWKHILGQLGSGTHPTSTEILAAKDVFARPPYNTRSLGSTHVKYLCGLNGLHCGPFRRRRLSYRTFCVHMMDKAIVREGNVHNMPVDALRAACFMRGLNAANMSNEELVRWLREWVDVSVNLGEEHLSLILHLPVLLGYNHPNNWQLIYKKR